MNFFNDSPPNDGDKTQRAYNARSPMSTKAAATSARLFANILADKKLRDTKG